MKMVEIEVGDKTYTMGFPTRRSALIAEQKGLDVINDSEKVITLSSKLFYTGLLAEQPSIKEDEAYEIMQQYVEEGGDLEELIKFLTEQFITFMKSPEVKKKKQFKIIEK